MSNAAAIDVGLSAVILAVRDGLPSVLTVTAQNAEEHPPRRQALPSGPLDLQAEVTLERTLRRWVKQQTGLDLGYVEQLYTFGDRFQHTLARPVETRQISIAYLALVRESEPRVPGVRWQNWYTFFPWEDGREAAFQPTLRVITPQLEKWIAQGATAAIRAERSHRAQLTFALGAADKYPWDNERVLERYELLYEVGLVTEAGPQPGGEHSVLGKPMLLDHRRMLATALTRLRGKIKYRPMVFELLPPQFTLAQLQKVVEALAGVRLHTQNFRRLVESNKLVESTGESETQTGGRPAALFRFRHEVIGERRTVGVGLPRLKS